jgi:hypothetical protein
MWLFAASSAAFALTLSGRVFTIATFLSVAVAAVNGALLGRQRKRQPHQQAAASPTDSLPSELLQSPTQPAPQPAPLTRTHKTTKE